MANNKLVTVDVLAYNNEKIKEQLNKKINIDQGIDNKGKLLGVDETGNVALVDTPDSVKVSAETDNQIEEKQDGIYVAPTDLSDYVEKIEGKGLSTHDLTDEVLEKINQSGSIIEISKADYDALTEEERKDKVFYVYDDDEGYDGNNTELDTAMSDTSENGVQNKVIKAYVDNTIKEETTRIETELQNTIQESVEQAVADATSSSSSPDTDAEIDSWF